METSYKCANSKFTLEGSSGCHNPVKKTEAAGIWALFLEQAGVQPQETEVLASGLHLFPFSVHASLRHAATLPREAEVLQAGADRASTRVRCLFPPCSRTGTAKTPAPRPGQRQPAPAKTRQDLHRRARTRALGAHPSPTGLGAPPQPPSRPPRPRQCAGAPRRPPRDAPKPLRSLFIPRGGRAPADGVSAPRPAPSPKAASAAESVAPASAARSRPAQPARCRASVAAGRRPAAGGRRRGGACAPAGVAGRRCRRR